MSRVHQLGALVHQALPATEQYRPRLLVGCLRRDEPHLGPLRRDHDRLGVSGVVLLALHEGPDILRRDEPHLVAKRRHLPCPVARARAGLEHHHRRGLPGHERPELLARQLPAELHLTPHRGSVNLENALCQIHPDHRILHPAALSASWPSEHHDRGTSRCRPGRAATTPSHRAGKQGKAA